MRRTRMNTAPRCQSHFALVARLHSKMRNGMEEVIGSMPTRSTKFSSGQFSSLRPCLRRSGAVCFPAGKTNW